MKTRRYPAFDPPDEVSAELGRGPLKAAVAQVFLGWMCARLERRTNGLLSYLGTELGEPHETLNACAPRLRRDLLRRKLVKVYRSTGGVDLLGESVSMAADVGLLMARLICLHGEVEVRWTVYRANRKNESYGMPVLVGWDPRETIPFDPLATGARLVRSIVTDGSAATWCRVYDLYALRAPPPGVPVGPPGR